MVAASVDKVVRKYVPHVWKICPMCSFDDAVTGRVHRDVTLEKQARANVEQQMYVVDLLHDLVHCSPLVPDILNSCSSKTMDR